jgi:hypothetical protein
MYRTLQIKDMNNIKHQPTLIQFNAFKNAYEYFNMKLFKGELPSVILNLSRKSSCMGFVAPYRWRPADAELGKGNIHELSLNPEILSMSLIDVYSTMVHEQCHIWQIEFGKPSRNGYHNWEWANKMLSVGLIPSDTHKEGGKMVGQNMGDYPQPNGVFLAALDKMPDEFKLPFVSVEGDFRARISQIRLQITEGGDAENEIGLEAEAPKPKSKNKYTCQCGNNVWGKVGLNIQCQDCEQSYEMVD